MNSVNMISIDIITKVVDNYGDAGVALRLISSLADIKRIINLRLFIDKPSILEQLISNQWKFCGSGTSFQVKDLTISVFDWKNLPSGEKGSRPDLLIEMFGAGLPEKYLSTVFANCPENTIKSLWLNLEHLTAETWAGDFHLIPSHSPEEKLIRYFFMPGFSGDTGGLIFDSSFSEKKTLWNSYSVSEKASARGSLLNRWGVVNTGIQENSLWISVFSYEKDFSALIDQCKYDSHITLLMSPGRGRSLLLNDLRKIPISFNFIELPFLPQSEWDSLLLACDINLVRGEESLSRAALSERPFLWQAYPLDKEEQLPKVEALCAKLCPGKEDLKELFISYNSNNGNEDFTLLWSNYRELSQIYRDFAKYLKNNGNCTDHLLLFFDKYIRLAEEINSDIK